MREWFELLTDRSADEITKLVDPNQTHPRQAKETLGKEIVAFYHGPTAADAAAAEFVKVFAEKKDPDEIREVAIPANDPDLKAGKMWIGKLLVKCGLAPSTSEAQRLVKGGGVTSGPERTKETDPKAELLLTDGLLVRVGSRKIARIRIS
jgi:tyrosyl-tRNA synthetase